MQQQQYWVNYRLPKSNNTNNFLIFENWGYFQIFTVVSSWPEMQLWPGLGR